MTRVAVATSSRLAADAACEIADRGGNAVDCAIAASLLTMNTEPGVCALAGGAYVTVWTAAGKPVTIDGNVAIPGIGLLHAADPAAAVPLHVEYGGGIDTLVGCGSVAVPGSLAALEKASCEFGVLDWHELFLPTIRAVDAGFPLPPPCHYYLQFSGVAVFGRSKDGFDALHYPDGSLRKSGDPIKVPHLADSLRAIAAEGSRVFYEGDIARAMLRHVHENGGSLTRDDLLQYNAIVRDSLTVGLDGWHIAVNPPPAIGGAVLAAMLVGFRNQPGNTWNSQSLQALVAVQQAALGYRRKHLDLSDDVSADVARLLKLARDGHLLDIAASGSTVHTSAVDDNGLGCAITASSGYGSGEMPEGTGLWLNNCLGELELNRRGQSAAPAGARLPSNMTPAIARRHGTVLAVGSPGADRITTALHQFFVNFIQHGRELDAAVAHPRLHLELPASGTRIAFEPGMQPTDCPWPMTQYPQISMYFGGIGAALFDRQEGFSVAADPRREGATFVST
ncbi:MAG: gamma-glutamyltransferase [Woeseia sp.]